ncbi:MAG TPA: hypothetical protein VD769_11100 [Gaiellaceae bacterium]|nr:hypothetical protein [Gaiellaceae bacterium]
MGEDECGLARLGAECNDIAIETIELAHAGLELDGSPRRAAPPISGAGRCARHRYTT